MAKKQKRKASYEGYMTLIVEEQTLQTAMKSIPTDFSFWDWIDSRNRQGYEFSFETEHETEYAMVVVKQMNPDAVDAGIYMFTTGLNTLEALILTWYKMEVLNKGQALKKSEAVKRSPYR